MRSKLFVPASRTELFAKALNGPADALSFDLEDAVEEGQKSRARSDLQAFLQSQALDASGKVIIVRVNLKNFTASNANVNQKEPVADYGLAAAAQQYDLVLTLA